MIDFAHVGIQKTGSTWLQTGLFAYHPELDVISGNIGDRAAKRAVTALYETPPDAFSAESWQRNFERETARLRQQENRFQPGKVVGMSNEQLSGYMFDTPTGLRATERLHALFGTLKIILVLRSPLTYIPSAYTQEVKSGGYTRSYQGFFADPATRQRVATRVDYHQLISAYSDTFGRHNLLVLPYELLCDDAARFLRQITDFLGIAPFDMSTVPRKPTKNQRVSVAMLEVLRQVNKVDHLIDRVIRRKKTRFLSRTIRRLMRFYPNSFGLKTLPTLSAAELRVYPEFETLLHDEHYAFWEGDLAQYNYTFDA